MSEVVDCTGTVNGIDPSAIITLTTDQYIPGETTFHQLEVFETLEVNIRH